MLGGEDGGMVPQGDDEGGHVSVSLSQAAGRPGEVLCAFDFVYVLSDVRDADVRRGVVCVKSV